MTENELKKEVIAIAKERGWKVFTLSQVNVKRPQKTSTGYPDLTLAKEGYEPIFIELKDDTRAVTPEQQEWGHALGDNWYVIRPKDLEYVVEGLLR